MSLETPGLRARDDEEPFFQLSAVASTIRG